MCDNSKDALEIIKEQLINDYYTPTYRFEVAFDTLITPYIEGIVNNYTYKDGNKINLYTRFVAKEMCLPRQEKDISKFGEEWIYGKNGAHIDYVLADDKYVYMVELKTAAGSIADKQVRYYSKFLGKTFGEILGKNLIAHIKEKYSTKYKLITNNYEPKYFNVEDFTAFLEEVFTNLKKESSAKNTLKYTDLVTMYLKQKELDSTYKYLYIAAQIKEYLNKKNELWNKKLKLIYLTPTLYKHVDIYRILKEENKSEFYAGTICLIDAAFYLENLDNDPLADMLAKTLNEIYGKQND